MKKLLWVCLLGLTMAIILWPVAPSPFDPMPVQSIHVIQNLPGFIVLFYAWAVVLAALLFLARGGVFERLALCLVFSIVFVQFWTFVSPWGTHADTTWLTGHVLYLQDMGQIPAGGHHTFRYFDYPALSLTGCTLQHITGMDIFKAIQVFLLTNGLVFVSILYAAFLKLMRTPYQAAIGVILALCSSMVLALVPNIFHPISLATTYIAMFLLLMARATDRESQHTTDYAIFILLVIAATVEYLFTPVLFALVILSGYILNRILRVRGFATLNIFMLTCVLFFSWLIYMTLTTFESLTASLPKIIADFQDMTWLLYIVQEMRTQGGPYYPWWGTVSRFFWWLFVLGLGSALVLRRMFHLRNADGPRRLEVAWFLGLVATVIIGSVGIPGVVHGGLSRYIWLAPFFIVPAVVNVLSRPSARRYAVAFALAGSLLLLPTFLSNADTVSRDTTYAHELTAGQFTASVYGKGEGLLFYSMGPGLVFPVLYTPDAKLRMTSEARGIDEEHVWLGIRTQLRGFFGIYDWGDQAGRPIPGYTGGRVLFVSSWKMRTNFQEKIGIPPSHPNWDAMEMELSSAMRIYDNRYLQLYVPPPKQQLVSFVYEHGLWAVGVDNALKSGLPAISPGTYRSSDSSKRCYWARLNGLQFEGDIEIEAEHVPPALIIVDGFADSPVTVTISESDVGFASFASSGSGLWTRIGD